MGAWAPTIPKPGQIATVPNNVDACAILILNFFLYFGYVFTGFTGARATDCVKIIENDTKIDSIDPWSAADNCAPASAKRV